MSFYPRSATVASSATDSVDASNNQETPPTHNEKQNDVHGLPLNKSAPWTTRILRALDHMFQTHVLQIDLLNSVGGGRNTWAKKKEDNWLWKYHRKLNNQSVVEGE